jgi:hypothetical protein
MYPDKMRFFIHQLNRFLEFIHEYNPMLLIYYEEDEIEEEKEGKEEEEKKYPNIRYEDKYLEKFKTFPNNYAFTDLELEQEQVEIHRLKTSYENNKKITMDGIKDDLMKITEIFEKVGNGVSFIETDENKKLLLEFNDFNEDDEEIIDHIHFDELYQDVIEHKNNLQKQFEAFEQKNITEDELKMKAREIIINKKLDTFINNYVLEYTPLGNIYMRYNNDKKSFEYFSNNTIPYRYLEPVGRKYVMTYWCKPLFVDIEEELKIAEQKYAKEQEKEKEEEENKKKAIEPKKLLAQFKHYNKDTKEQSSRPMKNRNNNNHMTLPPQIQANLPNINKSNEKQLLKEHANRYTWEGRLSNFCILKKINKKVLDKKLAMTYAEFKALKKETNE